MNITCWGKNLYGPIWCICQKSSENTDEFVRWFQMVPLWEREVSEQTLENIGNVGSPIDPFTVTSAFCRKCPMNEQEMPITHQDENLRTTLWSQESPALRVKRGGGGQSV